MTRPLAPLFLIVLLVIAAGALVLRLPHLDNRPMHADEAVHAVKFRELWEKGSYRYDPDEFHGPTLYYAALPVVAASRRQDFAATQEGDYRLPIAGFGAAMVLLLALSGDALGRRASLGAAALFALSPAFVFYSRYYIQEMLLAFFTLAFLLCGWRYRQKPSFAWAAAAGFSAGLMLATKETAVLAFVATAVALFVNGRIGSRNRENPTGKPTVWFAKHLALAFCVTVFTAALVLTNGFRNPSGALDYLRSYGFWLHRAQVTPLHQHSPGYYLHLLLWSQRRAGDVVFSEAFIVGLSVVGAVMGFTRRAAVALPDGGAAFVRFLAFYTLILTCLYSAVPYKTPWCVLNFLTGMILLAGAGGVALIGLVAGRMSKGIIGLLLLAGLAQLGFQAYRTSYVYFADKRNPYVYSPTAPETVEMAGRIEKLGASSPQGNQMVINIVSVDAYYWPLPWYLRRFPNIGYWTTLPAEPLSAPVVIASPEFDEELSRRLDSTHLMIGYYSLRPGVLLEMWVQTELWAAYLKKYKPAKEPQESEG